MFKDKTTRNLSNFNLFYEHIDTQCLEEKNCATYPPILSKENSIT